MTIQKLTWADGQYQLYKQNFKNTWFNRFTQLFPNVAWRYVGNDKIQVEINRTIKELSIYGAEKYLDKVFKQQDIPDVKTVEFLETIYGNKKEYKQVERLLKENTLLRRLISTNYILIGEDGKISLNPDTVQIVD